MVMMIHSPKRLGKSEKQFSGTREGTNIVPSDHNGIGYGLYLDEVSAAGGVNNPRTPWPSFGSSDKPFNSRVLML